MGYNVVVIGCGHVGLVTAAGLAALGHQVVGLDHDEDLVARLSAGEVDLVEPGLEDLVRDNLGTRLTFTTSYPASIPSAEVVVLAVDTPQTIAGAADLRSIRAAVGSLAATIDGTEPVIVNKSTSPVGTGETIEELLDATLPRRARVVANPEFLRQGHAVYDFWHPGRIVVGARDPHDASVVLALYRRLPGERIVTDLRTAELIKYAANAFLATRVSFANELARLCDAVEVDVTTVVDAIGWDPRIGTAMLRPGIGYGGSCLPKDVAALRYLGDARGVPTPLLGAVQEVNGNARILVVRRLISALGHLEGRTIAVWGMTFKGGTEDVRQSPAMDVIGLLHNEGAIVRAFDPAIDPDVYPFTYRTALEASVGADALVVLTDWPELCDVELTDIRLVMAGPTLIDGRNLLDPRAAAAAGFRYVGVGRSAR